MSAPHVSNTLHVSNTQLSVRDLTVRFPTTRGTIQAVNGVTFDLAKGASLGIVGESVRASQSLPRP